MSPRGQDVPAQVAWLASLLGLVLSCSAVVLRDFFFNSSFLKVVKIIIN